MDRALRQLDEAEPTLETLARELGYANVSTFCRAFRREVGCTPAAYWRRSRKRPFPRKARHRAILEASDDEEPVPSTPRRQVNRATPWLKVRPTSPLTLERLRATSSPGTATAS